MFRGTDLKEELRMKKAIALAVLSAGLSAIAHAQTPPWPSRPVRVLVPFPPGGGTDIQARLLCATFQKALAQNFIIDNRTGASGLIAAQIAVDSAPDGHTVYFTSGAIAPVVTLYAKRMKFDPRKDFTPVSWVSSTPLVLAVHPNVPVKSAVELIALSKTKALNGAGNTAGSTSHLAAEMLKQMSGMKATVVTYRGGGPAVLALVSGEVEYAVTTAPSIAPHLKSGRARGLAVTTAKRSSVLPDLPTLNTFVPGFEADNWYAMFAPRGTPRVIVDRLNTEVRKALETPEMREFMPRDALEPVGSTPEELAAMLSREIEKYAKVIRAADIRVE